MILPILEVPNSILRKRAKEIKKIDNSIKELAINMLETKRANFGIGLAAPQVGKLLKLIIVEAAKEVLDKRKIKGEEVPLTTVINPHLTKSSREVGNLEEACLSLPGLVGVVPRAKEVEVNGLNLEGKKVKIKAKGLFAQVLQHEIDHLDGILFPSKVKDIKTLAKVPVPYKIVFLGTPEFSVPILESLIRNGWGISLVVTEPDKPMGRKQVLTPPPVKKIALKYNLVIYQPEKIEILKLEIENLKPDLFILAAYGQILPKEILKIPKYGSICIHPSLLPKYRGSSPIQFAILNGERETGVTIFKMDEKIDHGPIIATEKQIIESSDNYQALSKKIAIKGVKLLLDTLSPFLEGKIKAISQNDKKASYTRLLTKEDGYVEKSKIQNQKSKKELQEIERKIRAFYPWPKVWTKVDGKRVIIHKAHLENNKLVLDIVQPEGKKPMQYEDYLKGNPAIS